MKLKFTQSVYLVDLERIVTVDEELELSEAKGKSFVNAGYAIELVEEVKVEKPKRTTKKQEKETGDE
jgi:hypothetical protein